MRATRPEEFSLVVIGDSATLGHDLFYRQLVEYIEQRGGYLSVWQLPQT